MVLKPTQSREKSSRFDSATSDITPRLDGHPIFCLKHLPSGGEYSIAALDKKGKVKLLDKLRQLAGASWKELKMSGRHQLGYEKIPRASINTSIPQIATEDVTFIAFRMQGKAPMVGFRVGDVYRLLWLDPSFSLYDHG